jgi:hypothetical protein
VTVASNIRLPGVYFISPPREAPPTLPPLDGAGFVGFAERGPINVPIKIEDLSVYTAVFGGDLVLAREEDGRAVYANLPSAVTAFFANGGRRCWVVRVAGQSATRSRLRVPGLVVVSTSRNPRLATIKASSEGGWSAGLRTGARLQVTPLPASAFTIKDSTTVEWKTGGAPQALNTGDLLRLTLADRSQWFFPISLLAQTANANGEASVDLKSPTAWRLLGPADFSGTVSVARTHLVGPDQAEELQVTGDLQAEPRIQPQVPSENLLFTLTGDDAQKIDRGSILHIRLGNGSAFLFPVDSVQTKPAAGSPQVAQIVASSPTVLNLTAQPLALLAPAEPLKVERMRFDLYLWQGRERRPPISDLSFNQPHPRFWGDVVFPESSSLSSQTPVDSAAQTAAIAARLFRLMQDDVISVEEQNNHLGSAALAALLAPVDTPEVEVSYLPVGMLSVISEQDIVAPEAGDIGSDGLDRFDPNVFLDDYLVPNRNDQTGRAASLIGDGFDRVFVQNKRLRGLHSLLFIDEVALLAAPDAVQRDWKAVAVPEPEPPVPDNLTQPPYPCSPKKGEFSDCVPPEVLDVQPASGPLAGGSAVVITGSGFVQPSGVVVRFGDRKAVNVIVTSPTTLQCLTPQGLQAGMVAVEVETGNGIASKPDAYSYDAPPGPTMPSPTLIADFDSGPLMDIQQALVNFAQARSDVLCVLTLPAHFEKRQCIEWLEGFRTRLRLPKRRSSFNDVRDLADLSYAAVYHPWLLISDTTAPNRTRSIPGDGAVCGMIASRELAKQVWVAPANTQIQGVLGLLPVISDEDWADLFDLQFNLVRREPRDFRAMSAHTLSDTRDLLQISVRRLLIQLRKAALERGMEYVFRPNNEHFREAVRLEMDSLLRLMFAGGAFTGAVPEEAYEITTSASVNTPQSVDQGRFIAEIRVAPSEPMEFITVLLTRIGEDQLQATEV